MHSKNNLTNNSSRHFGLDDDDDSRRRLNPSNNKARGGARSQNNWGKFSPVIPGVFDDRYLNDVL